MKTNTKLQSEIIRRNKLFKGKTRAEKRVLIAKDVLAQIKANTLVPNSGTWVRLKNHGVPQDASLRELALNKEVKCDCCALGGLFLSCTLFNNEVTVADVEYGQYEFLDTTIRNEEKFSNGLNTIFSNTQLKLIENAFEQGGGAFNPYAGWGTPTSIEQKAIDFGNRYPDDKARMVAIMKNIIKNNGTFVP